MKADTVENRDRLVAAFRIELGDTNWTIPPADSIMVFDMVRDGTYPVRVVEMLAAEGEPSERQGGESEMPSGEPEGCDDEEDLPIDLNGGDEDDESVFQRRRQ
jgi:hypothetical protein